MIVSEEGERNFRDVVQRALSNESLLQLLNDAVRDGKIDENSVLTSTLAGPSNEGGNYFLCVSIKLRAQQGAEGKEYIPAVVGLSAK